MREARSCRDAALALLARRGHTRRELERKLRQRRYAAEEIAGVLDGLAARGLVDDRKAGAAIVQSQAARGRGRSRIKAELLARGLETGEVDELLAELDPDADAASLRLALERRARTLPAGLTRAARSKKLFDHLVRRGFAPAAVLEALRQKGEPADDDE